MNIRERLAYFICPALRDEICALRDGNTKVVLENQRLLDRLAEDDYIDLPESVVRFIPAGSLHSIADRRIRLPSEYLVQQGQQT